MRGLPLAEPAAAWRWLGGVVRENRRGFALTMLLFVLATLVGLVGPQLLGRLVDAAVDGGTPRRVDLLAGTFLVVLLAQAALLRAARIRATVFGEAMLAKAREEFVGAALRLPVSTIEAAGTGELLSRTTTDVQRIDKTVRDAAPEIGAALLTVLLTAVAMIVTSPLLACGMLVAAPLIVFSSRWFFTRSGSVLEGILHGWASTQSSMYESVGGARTIDSLGLAARRDAHNERVLETALAQERRHRGLLTWYLPCLELSCVLPIAAILSLGAWGYGAGLVGLGTIATVVLYAQAMANPLTELTAWAEELQLGSTALRRVLGVSRAAPDEAPAEQAVSGVQPVARCTASPSAESGAEVAVRDLRFGYTPENEVLHGIDLRIPAGQRMVVVGPSGAGKSTLGRVLAGLSAPSSGQVTIGGTDITSLPAERLRRTVVLLTQEQHVFACTLRENLTLAAQATDAVLYDVLEAVGVVSWARGLPEGLDTVLGTGAQPVGGALAQQLALARVLLADPTVLVLDEATSLLDNTSSRTLENSLSSLLRGRTVVAIAHRLHTARTADRIAVLEGGRIVESGDHTSLLASDGSYAALHRAGSAALNPAGSSAGDPVGAAAEVVHGGGEISRVRVEAEVEAVEPDPVPDGAAPAEGVDAHGRVHR